MTSCISVSIPSVSTDAVEACLAIHQLTQEIEARGRAAAAPVGALERVVYEGALLDAPGRLTLRVGGEPVVGEDCVGGAVLLAVLEQGHPHPGHLRAAMRQRLMMSRTSAGNEVQGTATLGPWDGCQL